MLCFYIYHTAPENWFEILLQPFTQYVNKDLPSSHKSTYPQMCYFSALTDGSHTQNYSEFLFRAALHSTLQPLLLFATCSSTACALSLCLKVAAA